MSIDSASTRFLRLALVAVAALTIGLLAAGIPSAHGTGTASAAKKKKCGKKSKKSAESAKKHKKCKKKKGAAGPTTVVRATLNWSGGGDSTDLALFIIDQNGQSASPPNDAIPDSTVSADAKGGSGTETFTDNAFNLKRQMSFGVCQRDGGSDNVTYQIDFVTPDGVHHTDSQTLDNDGQHHDYPNGPTIPTYCIG